MSEIKWIKITTNMFDDIKIKAIKKMPDGTKVLLIWIQLLCLAGKVNAGGYIYFSESIPFDINSLCSVLDEDPVLMEMALKVFQRFEMISIENNGNISITKWDKHQNVDALKRIKELNRLRVQKHRGVKQLLTDKGCNVTRNITETLGNVTVTHIDIDIDIDKDKEVKTIVGTTDDELSTKEHLKTKPSKKKVFSHDSDAYRLSQLLFDLILANNPHSKLHACVSGDKEIMLQRWAESIDLLIHKDGQEPSIVEEVIRFCTADDFWRSNILSGIKLREKWDTLIARLRSKSGVSIPSISKSEKAGNKSYDAAGRELKYL